MKRLLIYTAIGIGILIVIFIMMVLGAITAADNPTERQQYAAFVGYTFGVLVMIVAGAAIIFGMFRLTITVFSRPDDPQEENVLDKDGPIDRYLK